MERLTETNNCIGFMEAYLNVDCKECQYKGTGECEEFKDECKAVADFKGFVKNMYSKLKEYEDLEEQGKLLKLPCAVGDTVYVLAECENIPTQLDGTLYGANGEPGTATGYYCPYENNCPFDDEDFEDCEKYKNKTAAFEDTVLFIACYENEMCVVTEKCAVHSPIGEYVFLTRQEAEDKLKEMEGKNGN